MTKSFKIFLGAMTYAVTIGVVAGLLAFWWVDQDFQKPGPLAQNIFFTVERGDGVLTISEKLKDAGAIDNSYVFALATRVLHAQRALRAGEYQFTPGISQHQILDKMRKGDFFLRRFTVREGLTSYEVVQLIKGVADLDGETGDIPAEGTLLPQTYDYKLHETRAHVIAHMKDDMTKTVEELWAKRAANLPFKTPEEAVTLASIVEKETGVASERPRIAGVFINRLRQNMALQSDPTVIYALTKGKPQNNGEGPLGRHIYEKDLQVDSPYNTYAHPGLPPGPIANPGRAALEAVMNLEANDFIYFVADGSGGHVFAKTLAEHNANVAKWQAIKREQDK